MALFFLALCAFLPLPSRRTETWLSRRRPAKWVALRAAPVLIMLGCYASVRSPEYWILAAMAGPARACRERRRDFPRCCCIWCSFQFPSNAPAREGRRRPSCAIKGGTRDRLRRQILRSERRLRRAARASAIAERGILAGTPTSRPVQCDGSLPADPVEQTATTGESGLTYDAATGVYTYVWKPDRAWAGACRQLTVTLVDGTSHSALFKLTR